MEVVKRIKGDSLPLHLLPCESWIFVKEKPDRKKIQKQIKQIMLYNISGPDSRCMWMKSVLNFSWQRSLLYRNQSIDLQNKSIDWFLYDRSFRHERVTAMLIALMLCYMLCYLRLLDYDKMIDIYASKY